ncbi:MAG TPA: cytidine deaminase [Gemmatimonadota bacterium]
MSGPDARLLAAAAAARVHAHAPYSGYAVGAALETASGRVFTGANVENASYGITLCAERVALVKAVSEGERAFVRIAVVGEGAPPFPCGACRQALAEFAPDLEVLVRGSGGLARRRLSELLPDPFRLTARGKARQPRGS